MNTPSPGSQGSDATSRVVIDVPDFTVSESVRGERTGHHKFIVLSSQRTGSCHLVSLLNSVTSVTCFGEIIDQEGLTKDDVIRNFFPNCDFDQLSSYRDREPAGFLNHVWHGGTSNAIDCIGFKLHYHHRLPPGARDIWQILGEENGLSVIHLYRRNTLAQFVSFQRALRSGIWFQRQNVPVTDQQANLPISVSIDEFTNYVGALEWNRTSALSALSGLRTIEVAYEDLVSSQQATLQRLGDFLGVNMSSVETEYRKQRVQPMEHAVSNWTELSHTLSGGRFARFLEEDLV